METEYFRLVFQREVINIVFDGRQGQVFRGLVEVTFGELVVFGFQDFRVEIPRQESNDESSVFVVSDSASIVDFCEDVVETTVGHFFLFF